MHERLAASSIGYLVAVAIAIAGHAANLPFPLQVVFVGAGGFAGAMFYLNHMAQR